MIHGVEPRADEYVGGCIACGGQMYRYEVVQCECGAEVHRGCIVKCANCEGKGCKHCKLLDPETLEYFCDTSGPDDCNKSGVERLRISECRIEFNTES